jgi:alpha-beta hydrolase superfamily lysophospholipase
MLDVDRAELTAGPLSFTSGQHRTVWIVGVVLGLVILVVAALYLFPLGSDRLQNAEPRTLSFSAAVTAGQQKLALDAADPQVLPQCRSQLLVHPGKSAKAVLMLHGYTNCPNDYRELAQLFYERGYNVYAPREPHHGLKDVRETSKVKADELAEYADAGLDVAVGLGDEVGVIGMSGGAVLATWLAEYRAESVAHLLVLAPFYKLDGARAPNFLIKPAIVLFGSGIVPDRRVGDTDFTFAGLAQYLRIVRNLRDRPVNSTLRSVAVAFSAKDPFIDQEVARQIPTRIATANGIDVRAEKLGAELNLPHNILAPESLGDKVSEIEELYFVMYEGKS